MNYINYNILYYIDHENYKNGSSSRKRGEFFIELKQNRKFIQRWGNHIDPEVCAQTYLHSEDTAVAQWAWAHLEQLEELDKETLNLYRRHMRNCDLRCTEDALPAEEQQSLLQKSTDFTDPSVLWLEKIFSRNADEIAQLFESEALYNAYMALTAHQKTVLYLRFVRSQSTAQIAGALSTSERNVRDIVQRALVRLRKAMNVPHEAVPNTVLLQPMVSSLSMDILQTNQKPDTLPWLFFRPSSTHQNFKRSLFYGLENNVSKPQCHSNTIYEL